MTYVRSDKYGDGKMCLTGSKVLCESKPLPHDLRDSPANEINIATLLSRFPELDVVIFEEAFMGGCWYDNHLVSMRAIMAAYGFPYYTETVGSFLDAYFIINGGVFIASRWPITSSVRMQFADSGHADKFSKKGAVPKIGDSYDKIRVKQAIELREFLANMKLPSSEPVLIGGDFNCDLNNNPTNVNDVISTGMNAEMPEIIGEVRATFDYLTNDVVEPGNTLLEWLDYVVHSRSHKAPKSASLEADRLTADQDITYCNSAPVQPYYVWPWASTCAKVKTTRHLSDHYPVIARFKFLNTIGF
uniref:sphingomyelin phosphodiesterase n=1 Tax=Macrostomum lignano TaxID=282301 RepID=A0A1I8IDW4_9PLAT